MKKLSILIIAAIFMFSGSSFYNLGENRIKGNFTKGTTTSILSSHSVKLGHITPTMIMLNIGFKL